uniref:Uncharacterized protein n=1 Tax=Oryza punctata TaxID=4537 RepID=A0A0E0L027_ORYPU
MNFIDILVDTPVLSVYDYVNETYAARVNPTFGIITEGYFTFLSRFEANFSAGCAVHCWRLCVMFLVLLITMALFLGLLLIDAVFIMSLVGPMASMAISLTRLIQHDFDSSDASNRGKLRAALFIFYSLALLHSLCFYFWLLLHFSLEMLPIPASIEYGHGDGYYQMMLRQYLQETKTKCANDPKLPGDWNLVTYAVGLLDSASLDDHLDGLRMLDVLVISKQRSVQLELLFSRHSVQNLIEMLELDGPDQERRERAARIVADAAGALRLAQMPAGALQCISSLLEASPRSDIEEMAKKTNTLEPKGGKELIHRGLQILERLARDEHNCREMCNTQWLLPKITAPITSPAFLETEYDSEWVDILSILLRLVMRLISAPGEAGTVLCHEISASNDAVHNLLGILDDGQIKCSLQLQENTMEILAQISISIGVPAAMTENLVKKLYHIFIANSGMSDLRTKAGEALVKLLSAQGARGQVSVMDIFCKSIYTEEICESKSTDTLDVKRYGTAVDQLTDILVKDKECRISAAAILENLCSCFIRSYELLDQDVVKLLISILDLILYGKTERDEETVSEAREMHNDEESKPPKPAGPKKSLVEKNDELSEERKHLAALLSLLVVICDNLVDADLFSYVTSVNDELVKKLKKIIEANNENTADCLRIVKLACQVVIAIINLKPSCLKDFNENNFDDVLSTAFKNMSDIENCMLFAVRDRQITKPARTLSSLVKEAQGLLHNAQETGNSST